MELSKLFKAQGSDRFERSDPSKLWNINPPFQMR